MPQSGQTCPLGDAGWSSPVARQAHNLKVVGSNPTPATNIMLIYKEKREPPSGGFFAFVGRCKHCGSKRGLAASHDGVGLPASGLRLAAVFQGVDY